MSNETPYSTQKYLFMTVDPVHIGTGGSRLGRVDNSIIREPGTRLPKIPGTSLSGAIRQYAAARNGNPSCAGQSHKHTAEDEIKTCPVCYTFGTANNEGSGFKGMVSIGDARLLCFPVYSMVGPVWVSSKMTLEDFGISGAPTLSDSQAAFGAELAASSQYINLGWLMVENKASALSLTGFPSQVPEAVKNRLVVISETLFSQVVNSNLEVRTSVSINPETGAAEDGALFTYEAIPRAAYLWAEIVQDDFRKDFPKKNGWEKPLDVVEAGLEWAEHLGVGGMGTRGFGRMRWIKEEA